MITDNIKTHFSCSSYTEQTLACIVEGVEILPSTPENVDIEALSDRSLKISWQPPVAKSNNITGYIINVTALRLFDQDFEVPEEDSYAGALARNNQEQGEIIVENKYGWIALMLDCNELGCAEML